MRSNWGSSVKIESSISGLSEATHIPNFSHFKVHAPCEITDEREKTTLNGAPNRCSAAVRRLIRSIPKTTTGFVVMADWNGYYKSLGIDPAPRHEIDRICIFHSISNVDPLIRERDLLRAINHQWASSQELHLRLTESCLQTAGSNACAAIVGSEDDLMTIITEGLSYLNSSDVQDDRETYQMLRIPIDDILENDDETVKTIALRQMLEDQDDIDVPSLKISHHLKVFLSMKSLWSRALTDYCTKHSLMIGQLCLLLLVQRKSSGADLDLPGGKRRLGETTMAGLLRNLKEGSGLKLRNLAISEHSDGDLMQSKVQTMRLEDTFDCYLTRLHS